MKSNLQQPSRFSRLLAWLVVLYNITHQQKPPAPTAELDKQSQEATPKPLPDAAITFASASVTITAPAIVISGPITQGGDTWQQEVRQSFEKYEERQEQLIADSYEKADSLLLTTASAILGLSIAFIGALFGKHPLTHRWEIFSGWGALGATIVFVLLSYFAARRSLHHTIELARVKKDAYLAEKKPDTQDIADKVKKQRQVQSCWHNLTEILNNAAACAFIVGLALIVLFAITNMR